MIKVALLTTDSREHFKDYANPDPYFGTAPEALLEGFKMLPDEIEVHVLSCLQQSPISSPKKLAQNIHYHGLIVPKFGWMRTGYIGCIDAVRRKLREIRPQIVHGQGTERDCSISAVFSGYPSVLTIHGHMAQIAKLIRAKPLSYYWLAAHLERLCLRKTDGVVAISSYTARNVARAAKRSWIVQNAVHGDFFDIKRVIPSKKTLVCVGNISPWKNQLGLIEALDSLSERVDFRLCFAGSAKQDAYSRRFLTSVAARDWCSFKGPLDREQIKELLASASAVILPSLEENCPMTVLEAAAAGVPIAASSVGGILDILTHKHSGLLFQPTNADAIENAAEELLADSVHIEEMAHEAKTRCKERNAPAAVAQQHLGIYSELTKATRGA